MEAVVDVLHKELVYVAHHPWQALSKADAQNAIHRAEAASAMLRAIYEYVFYDYLDVRHCLGTGRLHSDSLRRSLCCCLLCSCEIRVMETEISPDAGLWGAAGSSQEYVTIR